MSLSRKQKLFCKEYVVDLCAKDALIRAGYTPASAKSQASRMLKKTEIKKEVAKLQKALSTKLEIKTEDVVRDIAKLATSNIQDFIVEGNELKDLTKLPRDTVAAIESIKSVETFYGSGENRVTKRTTSIKLYNKLDAQEKLMKYLGAYFEDNKQKAVAINQIIGMTIKVQNGKQDDIVGIHSQPKASISSGKVE